MLKVEKDNVYKSSKILSFKKTTALVNKIKKSGKAVGMCHGGFDLLHPGHVKHFESAKILCDKLLVSITSDRFVSERKGEGRPIFTDKLRAYMVAALNCVDYVVISDFKKGVEVINKIKPSFYIKGPDFIGKQTPGITAEREAINAIGGQMVYTHDPKLSTTEIIEYIQKISSIQILVIVDRDGTLISNDDFIGRFSTWKKELKLNNDVISLLSYLQTKYKTTKIVVSNQSGVARGYFTENQVEEINDYIEGLLKEKGVKIDNWQYCPDVDQFFAEKHPELNLLKKYIKSKTERKPATDMVITGLQSIGKNISEFNAILVIGDRSEDMVLADKLNALFINVKQKSYQQLISETYIKLKIK